MVLYLLEKGNVHIRLRILHIGSGGKLINAAKNNNVILFNFIYESTNEMKNRGKTIPTYIPPAHVNNIS